jgi:hypothetical protein
MIRNQCNISFENVKLYFVGYWENVVVSLYYTAMAHENAVEKRGM